MDWHDFRGITPIIWPMVAGLAILVLGDHRKSGAKPLPPILALLGVMMSLLAVWRLWPEEDAHNAARTLLMGAVRLDGFGLFLSVLASISAIGTVLVSVDYLKRREKNLSEFYVLVCFCAAGMMLMGMSSNFISLLFGLEIMSISLYVLCGLFRERSSSVESSMKYYLTGSFATGLLIFGMALVYGGTGSLDLSGIGIDQASGESSPLVVLGLGFLLAGFGFKIAAAPFHMWLPDVYEGAPTNVTGFMATGGESGRFRCHCPALLRNLSE